MICSLYDLYTLVWASLSGSLASVNDLELLKIRRQHAIIAAMRIYRRGISSGTSRRRDNRVATLLNIFTTEFCDFWIVSSTFPLGTTQHHFIKKGDSFTRTMQCQRFPWSKYRSRRALHTARSRWKCLILNQWIVCEQKKPTIYFVAPTHHTPRRTILEERAHGTPSHHRHTDNDDDDDLKSSANLCW